MRTLATRPRQRRALKPTFVVDLDLDLDFSLDEEPASAISETPSISRTHQHQQAEPHLDLDFGLATEAMLPFETPPAAATTNAIEFSLPEPEVKSPTEPAFASSEDFKLQAATSFGATSPVPLPSSEPEASAPDLGMLEFDLGSLSLDLGDAPNRQRHSCDRAQTHRRSVLQAGAGGLISAFLKTGGARP